jgi:hypothetical protein
MTMGIDRIARRQRRVALLLLVVSTVATVAACAVTSSGAAVDDPQPATTFTTGVGPATTRPQAGASSTTAGSSTGAIPTTSTSSSGSTVGSLGTTGPSADPRPDGSGCDPGEGSGLGDGRWFGYATSAEDDELTFDLACWFSGEAAVLAAAADGEESPPPNDYYVRNANALTRTLRPGPEVPVTWYPEIGDPNSAAETTYAGWATERGEAPLGLWVTISAGRVTSLVEQWVP